MWIYIYDIYSYLIPEIRTSNRVPLGQIHVFYRHLLRPKKKNGEYKTNLTFNRVHLTTKLQHFTQLNKEIDQSLANTLAWSGQSENHLPRFGIKEQHKRYGNPTETDYLFFTHNWPVTKVCSETLWRFVFSHLEREPSPTHRWPPLCPVTSLCLFE